MAGGPGTAFTVSLPLEPPLPAPLPAAADRWVSDYTVRDARTRPSKAPRLPAQPRYVLLDPEGSLPRLLGRYMPDSEIVAVSDPDAALAELARSPAQALIVNTARRWRRPARRAAALRHAAADLPRARRDRGHAPVGSRALSHQADPA